MHRPLLATLLCATAVAQSDDRAVVIQVDRLFVAPGTVLEGAEARLAFRQGKVVAVGREIPAALLETAERVQFKGTAVPGFFDPHDQLKQPADLAERIDAFTPALLAIDAFDPFDETLKQYAEQGVTSVGLAPTSHNTFGGVATIVKWSRAEGRATVEQSYSKLALTPESLDQARYPTSRMGAADLIRSELRAARSPLAGNDDDTRVLRDLLSGSRTAAFHAKSHAEICEVLDLAEEFSLRPIIIGGDHAARSIDRLRDSAASLMIGPLTFDSNPRELELPTKLADAGIMFSFTAASPSALRTTAALAVRHGLARDIALAALTRAPAEQCGVADRVGSLRSSCDADIAIFDGPPLDLSSKLVAVYVDGRPILAPKAAEARK